MSFAGSWYSTWWGCIQCIWCLQVLFHRARRRGSVAPPAKPCCSCNFWDPGAMCESGEWGKVSVLGMCCLDFLIQGRNTYDSYDEYMNYMIQFWKMGMSTGDLCKFHRCLQVSGLMGNFYKQQLTVQQWLKFETYLENARSSRCRHATLWHCPMTCTRL